ncbi:LPXTG-motif cell wall-anchored protein [Streptacidiphilus sp. MAP12-20]
MIEQPLPRTQQFPRAPGGALPGVQAPADRRTVAAAPAGAKVLGRDALTSSEGEPDAIGVRPSRMRRLARGGWIVAAAAMASALITAAPAYASCAAPGPVSADEFTGKVLSTSRGGVDAQVRTLTGAVVEVVGSPAAGAEHTTVDRTYQAGAWYVFDPLNASSPFQDNACTATHALPAGWAPPSLSPNTRAVTVTTVAAEGSATWPWAAAGGAVVLAAIGGFVVVRRRRPSQ